MGTPFVKDTIAVCIPAAGPVEPIVLGNFMAAVNYAARKKVKLEYFEIMNRVFIHIARHKLAEKFLKSDAEWSLWLDSDMQIPQDTIPELLKWAKALDAKLLSAMYYHRNGTHCPLAMWNIVKDAKGRVVKKGKHKYESFTFDIPDTVNEAIEVDFCGFGCLLIHREVFEKMKLPYFKLIFSEDIPGFSGHNYGADGLQNDDFIGEDIYFCVKARELGYKIYVLPALDLGHIANPEIIRKLDYDKGKRAIIEKNPAILDLRLVKTGGVLLAKHKLKK